MQEGVGTGAKAGVLPKIEKNGWTGIAFVNTEASRGVRIADRL